MHVVALLYVLLLVLLPTQANLLEIHYFADTDDTCSSQPTTFEYASVGSCQYGYKVAGSSTGDGVVRYVYTTVDSTTVRLTTHAAGDTACTLPTLTVDVKLSTCTVDPSGTYVSYVSVSPSSPVPTPAFEYGAGSITTYPLCLNTNENQAITTRTVSNPERCSISEDDGRPTRQLCNATHIFTLKYNRTYAATECQGAGYLTGLTNMVDKSCVSGPDSVFSCLPVRTSNPTPTPDPTIPSNTWIMTERVYQDVASSAGGSATLSNGVTAFAFINTFVLVSGYAEDGSRAFHISPSNANFGSSVSVASLSDINGFVVVWLSTGNGTIHGRVYNNDGTARSDILTLFSAPTDSSVSNPYVTSLGTSRFGVVFSASSTTFNSDWIYGAVHNYAGEVLSRSIVCQSNATYSCAGGQPSISSFGAKGLLLAWLHFNPTTPDDISISGCLYNFEMVRLTNNVFPLSASEVATRRQLSLVYLSGDNIAAAWSRAVISPPASITSYEIIGCVFNPETNPMGCYNGNLRLHAVTTRDQVRPRISAVNPSEYLAVWVDTNFGVQGTIVNQNALPYTQGLLLRGSSSQVPFPTTLSANDNQVAFQLSFLSGSKIHTRFATYYKIGTNDRKKNDHGFFSFHNRVFIAILVGAGPLIIGLIVLFFVVLFRKKDDNEITNTNDPSFKALSNKSQSSWDSKSSSPSSPSPSSYQPAAVITSSPSSNNNFTTSYSSPNTETKSETSTPFTSSYNDGKSSTMKKPKRDTVDEEIAKLASFEMPLIMQRSATPVSETNDSKAIELDTFSTPTKKVESVDSRNSSFEEPPPAYSSSPPPYSSTPPDAAPAELSSIEPEITSDSPPSFSSLNQTIDDIFNTPSKPTEDNNNNNDSASKTDEIDAMADVDSTIAQMNDIVNQMNNMQNWLAN